MPGQPQPLTHFCTAEPHLTTTSIKWPNFWFWTFAHAFEWEKVYYGHLDIITIYDIIFLVSSTPITFILWPQGTQTTPSLSLWHRPPQRCKSLGICAKKVLECLDQGEKIAALELFIRHLWLSDWIKIKSWPGLGRDQEEKEGEGESSEKTPSYQYALGSTLVGGGTKNVCSW